MIHLHTAAPTFSKVQSFSAGWPRSPTKKVCLHPGLKYSNHFPGHPEPHGGPVSGTSYLPCTMKEDYQLFETLFQARYFLLLRVPGQRVKYTGYNALAA